MSAQEQILEAIKPKPTEADMLRDELRRWRQMVGVLVGRAGGEVVITHSELMALLMNEPEVVAWQDNADGSYHLRLLHNDSYLEKEES